MNVMKSELLKILRCPKTKNELFFEESNDKSTDGNLVTNDRKFIYPIVKGVPRFVGESNYADNFGMQWNHFSKTQLDSYSGQAISSDRFWKATGWISSEMKGKWILDVGCGSGRFAEVALSAGAKVVALDYSSAVDACYRNFMGHPNLYVVQGDIYELPFDFEVFSYIYSLGVLQHTPNPERAFNSLPPLLIKGGKLCVDYYEKSWKSLFLPKYWLRPFTKRISKKNLFQFLKYVIPVLLPLSRLLGLIPLIGHKIKKIIPVANYYGILPLTKQQQKEWSLLDTFDWLSPEHDHPQTSKKVKILMQNADFKNIEVLKAGHLVARGIKR